MCHQCIQCRFDALVGTEQSEGGEHTAALHAVLRFHQFLVLPRHHVRAMRITVILSGRDRVLLAQDPRRPLREDDHIRGPLGQCADHLDAFRRR
jgi:hypothetical protein